MNKLINIPYELTLFYVSSKSSQNKLFMEIVDKRTLNKKKREKITNYIINSCYKIGLKNIKEEDVNEVNIMNTSFKVILDDSYDNNFELNTRTSISGDRQEILVRIQSEELDDKFFGKSVYIYIRLSNFLRIINKSRNINNGNIQGGYYISLGCGDSINMILDNPIDKSLIESKRIGKLFGTKGNTSKWIPGYKYALNPINYVIYLGEINFPQYNSVTHRQLRVQNTIPIFNDMFSYNAISEKKTGKISLCINSRYLDDNEDINNFLIENKNLEIEDVLKKLLSLDNVKESPDCISLIKETAKKGVEIEKCINVSNNFNLESSIKNIIGYYINNLNLNDLSSKTIDVLRHNCIPELRLISINYNYFLSNNVELRKVILTKILELLSMDIISYKNSYRNSNDSDYIFNNCSNYYYYSVFILKNLKNSFEITDEYIKELIDSKLNTNGNN